ncbi:hypothetical protein IMCC20628_03653 [Hoeflea sp. IMCC20628]|uniref:hypothetical protein n=1 Tax=Hoeflea sp. IMCC20628 TaxID=1620421 RepID=UPI00063ABE2D|nr:hypothetical protein [Hoeflea sp. IMCC20628]AKI02337.1 hypothetical protein IMCC20628_03653 [Hoeflea sp. IMCC20628]
MRHLMTALLLLPMSIAPAAASSDDAWAEFAAEVRSKCLEAAAPMLDDGKAAVDPFGSESFGLAVVTGKAKGGDAFVSYICVIDKQDRSVELGSELTAETLTVTIP